MELVAELEGGNLSQKRPLIIKTFEKLNFLKEFIIFHAPLIINCLTESTFPKQIPIIGIPFIINSLIESTSLKEIIIFGSFRSGKGLV